MDTDVFLMQPRDVTPGDYFKYKESIYMNYSKQVASQIQELQSLMSEFRQKKKANEAIIKKFKKIEKRHDEIVEKYESIQDSFFKTQDKIYQLSNTLGYLSIKQEIINGRNKSISKYLSPEKVQKIIGDLASTEIDHFDEERSSKLRDDFKKYSDALKEYQGNYFQDSETASSVTFYQTFKEELRNRKEKYEKLRYEIDQTSKRMLSESMNRFNLIKIGT